MVGNGEVRCCSIGIGVDFCRRLRFFRDVTVISVADEDYISLTDIARFRNEDGTDDSIRNWLRNRNTLEFLGIWEQLYNPSFNPVEFDGIKMQAGLNSFTLTPKQWAEKTSAIGIRSKAGRYGGTFAHKDIAFEFASWISVEFKLYLIKEFQRLKEEEHKTLGWDIRRNLAKINYRIHTDAIQTHLIPPELNKSQTALVYASEADVLNMRALRHDRCSMAGSKTPTRMVISAIRPTQGTTDTSSKIENLNALFISQGLTQSDRLARLNEIAIQQMRLLITDNRLPRLPAAEEPTDK